MTVREPSVSLLVLCRNEGRNLLNNRDRLLELLDRAAKEGHPAEAILQGDGSTDETPAVIADFAASDPRVRGFAEPARKGKGGALSAAAASARGRYLVMLDADVPLDTSTLARILKELDGGTQVVLPSRRHPRSQVERIPVTRRLPSKLFNVVVNLLLGLSIADTQCGVKGFPRDVFDLVRPRRFLGYEMDLEMLARARRAGLRLREIPIAYRHGRDSGFSVLRDGPRMLAAVWRIRRAMQAGEFDPPAGASSRRDAPKG